jgi:hypothetical protein
MGERAEIEGERGGFVHNMFDHVCAFIDGCEPMVHGKAIGEKARRPSCVHEADEKKLR